MTSTLAEDSPTGQDGGAEHEAAGGAAPGAGRDDGGGGSDGLPGVRLPRAAVWIACGLWVAALVVGGLAQSLQSFPRDAYFSLDGQPVDRCVVLRAEVAESQLGDWCTPSEYLGPVLPEGVSTATGGIQWDAVDSDDWVAALSQPATWFAAAVGLSSLLVFGAFARATGTVRAGLAAAISVVFLALLLFPATFTAQIPLDLRSQLIDAWTWVILFYFGSEAAVQAWKTARPAGAAAGGDIAAPSGGATLR